MRLYTRLILILGAAVVVTSSVIGIVTYLNLTSAIVPRALARIETHARLLTASITSLLDGARADVLAIRSAYPVGVIARAATSGSLAPEDGVSQEVWHRRLAAYLQGELLAKPAYLQYRFIGIADGGRELVRVERTEPGGAPRIVPEGELKAQGQTDDFKTAIALAEGSVYVSPIEARRDPADTERPEAPQLRIASPVRAADGRVAGIVIITLGMEPIFAALQAETGAARQIYVVDTSGNYLLAQHAAGAAVARLADDFPQLADTQAVAQFTTELTVDRAGNTVAASVIPIRSGDKAVGALVETSPYADILAAAFTAGRWSLIGTVFAVLCAIVLAGLLARSLSRPLLRMTAAVEGMSRGERLEVPIDAAGEIGTLARAFHRMATDLGEKTASLEREVEERRRAQDAAAHHAVRERFFSAAVESSDDAILTHDLNGTITAWNAAAESLYGYTPDEAIGKTTGLIVPPDRRDEVQEILQKVFEGERVDHFETVRQHKNGHLIDVSLSISPVKSPSGTIVGASKIAHDITDKKLDEEKFRLAVEACPGGIVIADDKGLIVLVNAETERLFGYSRDDLIGKPLECLVPPRFQAHHPQLRSGYMAHPGVRAMGAGRDLYGLRQDGTEFPVEVGLNPIRSREGPLILCVVIDITARKQAERALSASTEELKRSNADLEQFAYVAAHDLQEPLRMVASYTELLGERYRGRLDEKADKYIGHAVDGAKRMQQLISDLLTYSRVGTEGKRLAPTQTGLVVNSVLERLRGKISETGANVACGILPTVDADEIQLGQLFQNLIGNALKFRAEREPEIRLEAVRGKGEWIFSVADNGIGINLQYGDRIFQMFQRLHERGRYEGSGIGLSIAKKIVERHGGRIWFESEENSGTTFYFTLPAARGDF